MIKKGETLVLATHNAGKLHELQGMLAPYGVVVRSAGELGLPEPEENGASFIDNARIKAHAAARTSGFIALADDSGLSVEGLDGQPGIHSARWAGESKDFPTAMARVESALCERGALTPAQRRAAFVCALCLAAPDGTEQIFEGRIDGTIVAPRGTLGFGYDPIFQPEGDTRTFGEMSAEEKHGMGAEHQGRGLSHRARAFSALIEAVFRP